MKRTLSLLLALVLVLGSFSTVFAAMPETDVEKAELLKELGVLLGNNSGDLMLDDDLLRRDAVVLLSRLMKAEETARNFPTDDMPFDDNYDPLYDGYIAWAHANGYAVGISATKFDPKGDLTAQQFATFLLRALGYEIDAEAYETAFETAEELGIFADLNVEKETVLKRKDMAVMTFNALYVPMKDSEVTLGEYLELELPQEEPVLSTDIEITAAKAIANNKVEVSVKEEVEASLVDFAIVEKGTNNEVEIKDLVKESAKVFVLETEALTAGKAYTVKSNGKELNFTGIAVDKTAPTVKSAKASDTNRFEIEFSDVMDKVTAEDVENYEFNKELKVVSATLKSNRKVVVLETDAAKKNTTYKLTIENVANSDGVAMKKFSQNVRAIEYTTAPTVQGLPKVISSTLVEITFNEGPYGMNKESLEAVENYEIDGLNVVEAKAYDRKGNDGLYDTVLLTTEEQETNKSYKLTISGVTDDSVLKNVIKSKTFTFRGMRADKTAPTLLGNPVAKNANVVELEFYDTSALNAASLEDMSNYKITYRDGADTVELDILEAEAWSDAYPYAYIDGLKGVTLITEEQDTKVTYTIEITGVEDEYGNAMKTVKRTFKGSPVDVTPPTVKSVKHTGSAVVVEFAELNDLNGDIAKDPTNYTIDGGIGKAISASAKASEGYKIVTLKTDELVANKSYKLTIENIEDEFGNLMPSKTVTFIAQASDLDTTPPKFTYAYAENSVEVHINFDEAIVGLPTSNNELEVKDANGNFVDSGITLDLAVSNIGKINDGTTVVFRTSSALQNKEYRFKDLKFKDAAGNEMSIKGETFQGVAGVANEKPKVEYAEQVNVKTLIVTFDEPVKLDTSATFTATSSTKGSVIGTAKKVAPSKNTHETEWKIVFNSPLTYGVEYTLSGLTVNVEDLGGETVANNYKFTADYYDDVAPSIVGVEAIDNSTVVVEYDEDLSNPGTYQIYYIDENTGKAVTPAIRVGYFEGSDRTKVYINYTTKGSMVYYLSTKVGAQDLAGKREKIDNYEWDFIGTDVLPTDKYVTGVSIINATDVKVSANFNIAGIKVYEVDENKVETFIVSKDYTVAPEEVKSTQNITVPTTLLAGYDYKFVVSDGTDEFTFVKSGVTPDLGLSVEIDGTTRTVKSYNTDITMIVDSNGNQVYTVDVIDANGNDVSGTYVAGDWVYVLLTNNDTGAVVYAAKVKVQ